MPGRFEKEQEMQHKKQLAERKRRKEQHKREIAEAELLEAELEDLDYQILLVCPLL